MELTHIDKQGNARMVSVGEKPETERMAVASGEVWMRQETCDRIREGGVRKGDVLTIAQVAGIMAAKHTADWIPLCHPLALTGVDIQFHWLPEKPVLKILATVRTSGRTGVEMEAMTAVSATALTLYDMCKAMDRDMVIRDIRLEEKSGGKSGHFRREEQA